MPAELGALVGAAIGTPVGPGVGLGECVYGNGNQGGWTLQVVSRCSRVMSLRAIAVGDRRMTVHCEPVMVERIVQRQALSGQLKRALQRGHQGQIHLALPGKA
jgi:hypothetical protein